VRPVRWHAVKGNCAQPTMQRRLGDLGGGIVGVAHEPGADIEQPLAQAEERSLLNEPARCQGAHKVRQIVGQHVEPELDGVFCSPLGFPNFSKRLGSDAGLPRLPPMLLGCLGSLSLLAWL
jgi:hypothetical protein